MEDHAKTNWTLRLLLHLCWLEQVMHSHLTSPAQKQLWELPESKAASACPQFSLEIKVWGGKTKWGTQPLPASKGWSTLTHSLPSIFWSEPLWQGRKLKMENYFLCLWCLKFGLGWEFLDFSATETLFWPILFQKPQSTCEQNNWGFLFSLRWWSLILYVIPFLKETR